MGFQEALDKFEKRRDASEHSTKIKELAGIIGVIIVIIGFIGWGIWSAFSQEALAVDRGNEEIILTSTEDVDEVPEELCVYVSGCVVTPGVVYLEPHARINDAIVSAGGFTAEACRDSINLAQTVEDGMQIHIPSIADAYSAQSESSTTPNAGSDSGSSSGSPAGSSKGTGSGKVNLNTATMAELMSLSGIGESKARKIISYREDHGPFKRVEDLTNVSGIGEKTVASLRDSICV